MPLCVAVTVQAPTPASANFAPLTLHTLGVEDARVTVRPEVEVAIKSALAAPKVWLPGDAKAIVCAAAGSTGSLPPPPPQALSAMRTAKACAEGRKAVCSRIMARYSKSVGGLFTDRPRF